MFEMLTVRCFNSQDKTRCRKQTLGRLARRKVTRFQHCWSLVLKSSTLNLKKSIVVNHVCIPFASVEVFLTLPGSKYVASNDPPVDADPHNGSTHNMVGHFDNGADALQTIFEEKVKKRDKEQFKVIKGDMDSVFLLVRSYFQVV